MQQVKKNGIDVHMMLPTEYGAVAILSASGYGNSGKLRDETDPRKKEQLLEMQQEYILQEIDGRLLHTIKMKVINIFLNH